MRITGSKSKKRTHRPSGYSHGQWKMTSDRSGQAFLNSDIKTEWTGLKVAKHEWEPRHPQEYVRGVVDDYAVRDARPRPDLLSALSFQADFDLVSERDGEIVTDRDGNELTLREGANSTIGQEYTVTDTRITLYGGDLGSDKYVSFLDLTLTIDDLTQRDNLRISYAKDGDAFTVMADGVTQDMLENLVSGSSTRFSIGQTLRYIELEILSPTPVTVTYTVGAFALYQ